MVSESLLRHWHGRLYRAAESVLSTYKPCKIKDGTCIKGRVLPKWDHNEFATGRDGKSFCCGAHRVDLMPNRLLHQNCPGLIKDRCRLMALCCRVWLCYEARNRSQKAAGKLDRIYHIARRAGFRLDLVRYSRAQEIEVAIKVLTKQGRFEC